LVVEKKNRKIIIEEGESKQITSPLYFNIFVNKMKGGDMKRETRGRNIPFVLPPTPIPLQVLLHAKKNK
jgi:hypothetical protein